MINIEALLVDPLAASALHAAGWQPARRVDVSQWEDWYEDEGYEPSSQAIELLSSMGGLEVVPIPHSEAEFSSGRIVVDPIVAATGESDRILGRQEQLEEKLWPVGEWCDTYILLLGSTGALYAEASDFGVEKLGETLVAGLALLLTSKGPIENVVPMGE